MTKSQKPLPESMPTTERKSYRKPQLLTYGRLSEITATTGKNGSADNPGPGSNKQTKV